MPNAKLSLGPHTVRDLDADGRSAFSWKHPGKSIGVVCVKLISGESHACGLKCAAKKDLPHLVELTLLNVLGKSEMKR